VTPPVLEAADARIGVDGLVIVDRLSLVTRGGRVVLSGDVNPLFALLMGTPSRTASRAEEGTTTAPYLAQGMLRLVGEDVARGAHVSVSGAASLDPATPAGWTATDYVEWGARLAGIPRRDAMELAQHTLRRLGLDATRRKALVSLSVAERRAVVLAQAVVSDPRVLVAEAPLSGLTGAAAAFVLQALVSASEERAALVSVTRLSASSAEGALARAASHLVVLAAGEVAVEGLPAELFRGSGIYALTVRSNVEPFRNELAARGISLQGGPTRFSATLVPGRASAEILAAAGVAKAAVVEMVPVIE
jgi:ABC-type multidrug transport system ATPase subunit